MATPILAGTAAMALHFVAQQAILPASEKHRSAFELLYKDYLRTTSGILLLLERATTPILGPNALYVAPTKFLTSERERDDLAWDIYNLFNERFNFKTLLQ
jgi:hypothetical protein